MSPEELKEYLEKINLEFKEVKNDLGEVYLESNPPEFKYTILFNKEEEQYNLLCESHTKEWFDTLGSAKTLEKAIKTLNIDYNMWNYLRSLKSKQKGV